MTADSTELIAQLEEQERRLVFRRFTNGDAWAIGSRLVSVATERKLAVTIDIRRNGQQLFHAALDGTAPDNDMWVSRKINVVNRYGSSSLLVGRRLDAAGVVLGPEGGVDLIDFAAHGGAFPVTIENVGVVGAIAVSGLPSVDDHALVVEIIEEFLAG